MGFCDVREGNLSGFSRQPAFDSAAALNTSGVATLVIGTVLFVGVT